MFSALILSIATQAITLNEMQMILSDPKVQSRIGSWQIGKITETARWRVNHRKSEVRISVFGPEAFDQDDFRVLIENDSITDVYSDESAQCGTLLTF